MPPESWNLDAAFEADYLHFYEPLLGPEIDDAEAYLLFDLLELRPGDRVLDAGCGHGRIANRLAANGCEVVGIDQSKVFLRRARQDAEQLGLTVDYREQDLRELDLDGEFDAVVHWFTSFGYFDDTTNRDILGRLHRALRPGGRLALETANLFAEVRDEAEHEVKRVGPDLMIDERRFEAVTGRRHVRRTVLRHGRPTREFDFWVRLFAVPELRDWLRQAGFDEMTALDGEGGPFDIDSDRLVMVATKAAGPATS